MPSTFSSSEKSTIKSVLASSNKIITVTPARIYVAYPTPDRWYYTGIEGALAFVRDAKGNFGFRIVDVHVCTRMANCSIKETLRGSTSYTRTSIFTKTSRTFTHLRAMYVKYSCAGMYDWYLLRRRIWRCTAV